MHVCAQAYTLIWEWNSFHVCCTPPTDTGSALHIYCCDYDSLRLDDAVMECLLPRVHILLSICAYNFETQAKVLAAEHISSVQIYINNVHDRHHAIEFYQNSSACDVAVPYAYDSELTWISADLTQGITYWVRCRAYLDRDYGPWCTSLPPSMVIDRYANSIMARFSCLAFFAVVGLSCVLVCVMCHVSKVMFSSCTHVCMQVQKPVLSHARCHCSQLELFAALRLSDIAHL